MTGMIVDDDALEIARGEGRAEVAAAVWSVLNAAGGSTAKIAAIAETLESYRSTAIIENGYSCEWCSKTVDDPDNVMCPHCDHYWSDWIGEMDATVILEG